MNPTDAAWLSSLSDDALADEYDKREAALAGASVLQLALSKAAFDRVVNEQQRRDSRLDYDAVVAEAKRLGMSPYVIDGEYDPRAISAAIASLERIR